MLTSATTFDWAVFVVTVVGTMGLDRLAFGNSEEEAKFAVALRRSVLWLGVGVAFTAYVAFRLTTALASEYLTAYLVEKSLSVDNLFVFLVLFRYFRLDSGQQHRVLRWGVAGAIIMRGVFVVAGAALLHQFQWLEWVFGAFLIYTGGKLAFSSDEGVDPETSTILRFARRYLRTSSQFEGQRFFIRRDGALLATPLLLVIVVVELTDVMFALDSVPAVLAVSPDLYVVYTSNIFAILGLRALFFVVAGAMGEFRFLRFGLSGILAFIGAKMVLAHWWKLPSLWSLLAVTVTLVAAVVASLLWPERKETEGKIAGLAADDSDPKTPEPPPTP
jgi:tellurite resistance protein TerC